MTPDAKQQFNVYLPPALVRQVKHAAVDTGQSLSAFVADALQAHVERLAVPSDPEVHP